MDKITNKWHPNIEEYIKTIGEYSQCYYILHRNSEKKYNKISYSLDIPTIIISTIVGTLSISSSGLFESSQKTASVFIGILSLTGSILTTINSYFSFSKRAEKHRLSGIGYQRLYLKIDLILGQKPEERPPVNEFLKTISDEYNRLSEISPVLDESILNDFKTNYKDYKDIVQFPPETNGLNKVTIYQSESKLVLKLKNIADRNELKKHSDLEELKKENAIVATEDEVKDV